MWRCLAEKNPVRFAAERWHPCNQTIVMTKNYVFRSRTKHIELRRHSIRKLVQKGEIQLEFFTTKNKNWASSVWKCHVLRKVTKTCVWSMDCVLSVILMNWAGSSKELMAENLSCIQVVSWTLDRINTLVLRI